MQKFTKFFASIAGLVMLLTSLNLALAFTDIDSTDWELPYVDALKDEGVVNDATFFHPKELINRAEVAKMLVKKFDLTGSHLCSSFFTDCTKNSWYDSFLGITHEHEIFMGDSGKTTMRPSAKINRAELAAVLKRSTISAPVDVMGSDIFPDVPVGIWYDEYLGWAYCYNIIDGYSDGSARPVNKSTRAEFAKMLFKADEMKLKQSCEASEDEKDDDSDDDEDVVTGFTVGISGNTPDEASIPRNGFDIPYTTLTLDGRKAESSVKVTQVTVTRSDLGSPSNFQAVRLYAGDKQIGSDKTISTSANQAVFNNLNINVPKGSLVELEIRADMSGGNIAGSRNRLGVAFENHIQANAEINGNFPIWGNPMTVANAQVGTLTVTHTDVTGDLEIGDKDEILGKIRLEAAGENIQLREIRYKQTGSAQAGEDLAKLQLRHGSNIIAEKPEFDGDYLVFDVKPDLEIKKGDDINVSLYGDVVGGIGSTAGFEIKEGKDITAYGLSLGYRVQVTESASFTPTARNITGGVVNFSLAAGNPPSQEIGIGADDVEMMMLNVITGGDAIVVKNITFVLNSATANLSELDDIKGYRVTESGKYADLLFGPMESSTNSPGSVSLTFTDDWEVPENSTYRVALVADVATGTSNNDTFRLDLDVSELDIEYASNMDSVAASDITPSGDINGSTMTVAAPTLTVSRASVPQDKTVVKNAKGVDLVGFNMQANNVSSMTITSLKLSLTSSTANATFQDVNNCRLYEEASNGVRTPISSLKSLTDASQDYVTFSSLNHTIAKGDSDKVLAVCDIPSSATVGRKAGVGIAANGDVSAQDSKGNTSTVSVTGAPVNLSGTAADVEVEIVGSGTLSAVPDGDTPTSYILPAGGDLLPVTTVRFETQNDAFTVTKFQVKTDTTAGADELTSFTVKYKNKDGEEVTSAQTVNQSGVANFSGQTLYMPKNSQSLLKIYANLAHESDGADSGTSLGVDLDFDTNFEAVSEGANTLVQSLGSADFEGQNHEVYAGDLLVKVANNTPTSSSVTAGAGQDVLKLDFKASGDNTPSLMALALTSSGTSVLDRDNTSGPAILVGESGNTLATENYAQATSNNSTSSTTQIGFAVNPSGVPVGANVMINDGTTNYVRKIAAISGNVVIFTPAISAYDDDASDTLSYIPLQPGAGKVYFGAASKLTADLADGAGSIAVVSTDGFSVGDTLTVRGGDTNGIVRTCTGTITAIPGATALTATVGCPSGNIDFNYSKADSPAQTAVAYAGLIAEEISGEETLTVRGDLTGAAPSGAGSRTVQLRVNAASDISWHDDWVDVGEDLDGPDENTQFIIQSTLLNKGKEGYKSFPLNGSTLSFGG